MKRPPRTWNLPTIVCSLVLTLLSATLAFVTPNSSAAAENLIRFGLPTDEYPPYLMKGPEGQLGIVGDAVTEIAKSTGFKLKIINLPSKRLRMMMAKGELDAIASATEWEADVSNYIWTRGIILVSDNIVLRTDQSSIAKNAADLKGKTVAVKSGLMYPSLDKMIADGDIISHSTKKFESLLRMIGRKHVEYGILDQNVAKWIIRKNRLTFSKPLRFISPGFDEVKYRIILRSKEWTPFLATFNKAIAKLKASDRWQAILNDYR
jgi:ABC-type amino acid transport substrate-binding protein